MVVVEGEGPGSLLAVYGLVSLQAENVLGMPHQDTCAGRLKCSHLGLQLGHTISSCT